MDSKIQPDWKRKISKEKSCAPPSDVLNSPVPEKDSHLLLYGERLFSSHLALAEAAFKQKNLLFFWFHSRLCDCIFSTLTELRQTGKLSPDYKA